MGWFSAEKCGIELERRIREATEDKMNTMKIYTAKEFDCPYCKGHGYFTVNSHHGNPEYDSSVDCPKCNDGEISNKCQSYDEMRKLTMQLVAKSAEMAKVASEHYHKILQECLDMDYALASSKFVEVEQFDKFQEIDTECQELQNLFEEFGKNKSSFIELLESCSGSDDFSDAEKFTIEDYYD